MLPVPMGMGVPVFVFFTTVARHGRNSTLRCRLFTGVRGRGILRSPFAGSCIECPPRVARMASEATHATWEGSTCCGGAQRSEGVNKSRSYQMVLDRGYAVCWIRTSENGTYEYFIDGTSANRPSRKCAPNSQKVSKKRRTPPLQFIGDSSARALLAARG